MEPAPLPSTASTWRNRRYTPLRRQTPLRTSGTALKRTEMKRGPAPRRRAEMPRGGPLPKANRERLAARREKQRGPHGEWVSGLPCCTCYPTLYVDGPDFAQRMQRIHCGGTRLSDPSHFEHTRGAGGGPQDIIPQCRACHDATTCGVETYAERNPIVRGLAARLWEVSPYGAGAGDNQDGRAA